jgi:hypothetical protein
MSQSDPIKQRPLLCYHSDNEISLLSPVSFIKPHSIGQGVEIKLSFGYCFQK